MVMQKDVDLRLIVLIGVAVGALVVLTLYFQLKANDLIDDYNELKDTFEEAVTNLTGTRDDLQLCLQKAKNVSSKLNDTLSFQEESRSDFNKIYEETESQLQTTEVELENSKAELAGTKKKLKDAENSLAVTIKDLDTQTDRADKLDTAYERYQDDIDDCVDDGDISSYSDLKSCIEDA